MSQIRTRYIHLYFNLLSSGTPRLWNTGSLGSQHGRRIQDHQRSSTAVSICSNGKLSEVGLHVYYNDGSVYLFMLWKVSYMFCCTSRTMNYMFKLKICALCLVKHEVIHMHVIIYCVIIDRTQSIQASWPDPRGSSVIILITDIR